VPRKVGQRSPVYLYGGNEYTLSASDGILADLCLRDLTINAMAQDADGRVWAHPDARRDLDRKILRPISAGNFIDDPLRVFRIARFCACMPEFSCHATVAGVVAGVRDADLLGAVSAERVGQEALKAFGGVRPGRFLRFLDTHDLMRPWFGELAGAGRIPAGPPPHHNESVLEHLIQVTNRLAGDPLCVWMGLCHDLGKTATESAKWPSHHRHETVGTALSEALAQRLRLPTRYVLAGSAASRWHMTLGRYRELRPGKRVDLLVRLHRHRLLDRMARLVVADGGDDLQAVLARDLAAILALQLPESHRGKGDRSGQLLRQMRCETLASLRRSDP
jgi:tRNA nucleotidyltransferase (CCA-adding enzyme)